MALPCPRACSGAMQLGVPTMEPVWDWSSGASRSFTRPKSVALGTAAASGLEVAVDDTRQVRGVHRPGELGDEARRVPRRLRRPGEHPGEAAARHVLHREERQPVVLADLVDLHDVRVGQPRDRLGLAAEAHRLRRAGRRIALDHLDGDDAVEAVLPGLVDDAHAAAPQLPQHLVAGDDRAGRRGHNGRRRLRPLRVVTGPPRRRGRRDPCRVGVAGGRRRGRPRVPALRVRVNQRAVDLELQPQFLLVLREAADVLLTGRRLAPLLAEEHLAVDEVEQRLGLVAQPREPAQVRLDEGTLAAMPAPPLVGPQHGEGPQPPRPGRPGEEPVEAHRRPAKLYSPFPFFPALAP